MVDSIARRWNINGNEVAVCCAPEDRLLDVLRNRLGLTGTKPGCEEGECGACSVIIDGVLKLACLTLAATLPDGTEVMTVEGIETDPLGAELVESFVRSGAVQCGYCTPGMLVAAYWVRKTPGLSPADGLAGNLCRCTGYQKILEAVAVCDDRSGGEQEP